MESKIIFDVATRSFDWQPITVSTALFVGGCAAVLAERLKWGHTAVKNVGYFLMILAVLTAGYVSLAWYTSRRDHVNALASGQHQVVEGAVENLRPMYFKGRKEESFTISGRTFSYSDYKMTGCFNRTAAHGGPMQAGLRLRVKFIDECILRIEVLSENQTRQIP